MTHADLIAMLAGVDRRSIGRSDEAGRIVLTQPRLFAGLLRAVLSTDPVLRMRAADAAEKVSRVRPDLLAPHHEFILAEIAPIDQKEVRWHAAQLIGRLSLSPEETRTALKILGGYTSESSSILRTFAMQALTDLALRQPELRKSVAAQIASLLPSGTPAMKSRGKKLLAQLAAAPAGGSDLRLTFKPLTPRTWKDFVSLFGERGACGGCWCMSWRQSRAEYARNKGMNNRRAMQRLVRKGEQLGILAYANGAPIGWCALAPREDFTRLAASRVLRPVDDRPVWSIPCFFLAKGYRRKGLSTEILKGVIAYSRTKGVRLIEAYPIIPYGPEMPAAFAWTGVLSSFLKAGFREERRHSKARPIVRYEIS